MTNPFKFGKAVAGDEFYDRTTSFRKLYTKLAGGASNVVMYAPRRYGKTSLVNKVLKRFAAEDVPTLSFNLNRVETIEKFCEQYTAAVCSLLGRGQELTDILTSYLSHLHPTITLGGEGLASIRFDYGAKMSSVSLASVLDFAEKVAAERLKKPIIVAFDEFQEIERLSSDLPLEGIFRSSIQEHQNVRYIFFGSKTHLLKRMFGEKSRPFYKSAATMRLDKPPADESKAFVLRRFAARSIGIDEATAERIVNESDNVPYYLQQLSALTFDAVMTREGDWVEERDVDVAVQDLLDENGDYYTQCLSTLSPMQRLLLSALAAESTKIFSAEYRKRYNLAASSTVHASLSALVDLGVVESDETGYFLGDPFFARYICASPYETPRSLSRDEEI